MKNQDPLVVSSSFPPPPPTSSPTIANDDDESRPVFASSSSIASLPVDANSHKLKSTEYGRGQRTKHTPGLVSELI